MLAKNRISAVLCSTDLERSQAFYEQKVGLPTSCFGETRHYVTTVTLVEEIPLAPGVVVPTPAPAQPPK